MPQLTYAEPAGTAEGKSANAARCVALGAGLSLDPLTLEPDDARAAVATVLADPRYRSGAERLRDELAAQPPVVQAVSWIESLA
jgi:UDP:flavonoid glycosyltransferase YjiC (YdhE family)